MVPGDCVCVPSDPGDPPSDDPGPSDSGAPPASESPAGGRNAPAWSIRMINDSSNVNDAIAYRLTNVWVDADVSITLAGTLTIPPREIKEWHWIWACARADGSEPSLEVTKANLEPTAPSCELRRVISAWGTMPDDPGLLRAQQIDDVMLYTGNYEDPELIRFQTEGRWIRRDYGGYAPRYVAEALHLRLEAGTVHPEISLAQVNVAMSCEEGETSAPWNVFMTDVKGLSRNWERSLDASRDDVWVPVDSHAGHLCILVNINSRGNLQYRGFRIAPDIRTVL
jgi:hypothetical protein